ncbi:SHOCT domain-containing protein [Hymenobacter sp. BT730]|uniref:SHOCT domain-containing protein n=1 Tax=Hymenobacter sp. BT730 TaxID=3063332 RepID=UPI0026DF9DAA|nr:SHOCT domain-containing protein [Hymenobacter sp. BT730]
MPQDPSPLDTLRQLKEWLDAGTITQQEFDTLKRKLLFSEGGSAPSVAPASEPTETSVPAPVEDPLLPPYTVGENQAPIPAPQPQAPATPAENFSHPIITGRPGASPTAENPYESAGPAEEIGDDITPPRNPLALVMIIGGVVALLGLVFYLMMGSRESEHLTSTSQSAADSVAVRPEEGPQAEQIELPPAAAPETVRVVPATPPAATPTGADSTAPAASQPTPAATPAPAAASDGELRTQIESALASYYEDLKAAPFDASQHFAAQVERFYTQQNTTPAAIEAELAKSHFPEFQDAETIIEPGSLQIGPETNDGSRVVTYREKSRAYRVSRQQHQQTTAQVRVRFNRNLKMVYLRQERLLENSFTD